MSGKIDERTRSMSPFVTWRWFGSTEQNSRIRICLDHPDNPFRQKEQDVAWDAGFPGTSTKIRCPLQRCLPTPGPVTSDPILLATCKLGNAVRPHHPYLAQTDQYRSTMRFVYRKKSIKYQQMCLPVAVLDMARLKEQQKSIPLPA